MPSARPISSLPLCSRPWPRCNHLTAGHLIHHAQQAHRAARDYQDTSRLTYLGHLLGAGTLGGAALLPMAHRVVTGQAFVLPFDSFESPAGAQAAKTVGERGPWWRQVAQALGAGAMACVHAAHMLGFMIVACAGAVVGFAAALVVGTPQALFAELPRKKHEDGCTELGAPQDAEELKTTRPSSDARHLAHLRREVRAMTQETKKQCERIKAALAKDEARSADKLAEQEKQAAVDQSHIAPSHETLSESDEHFLNLLAQVPHLTSAEQHNFFAMARRAEEVLDTDRLEKFILAMCYGASPIDDRVIRLCQGFDGSLADWQSLVDLSQALRSTRSTSQWYNIWSELVRLSPEARQKLAEMKSVADINAAAFFASEASDDFEPVLLTHLIDQLFCKQIEDIGRFARPFDEKLFTDTLLVLSKLVSNPHLSREGWAPEHLEKALEDLRVDEVGPLGRVMESMDAFSLSYTQRLKLFEAIKQFYRHKALDIEVIVAASKAAFLHATDRFQKEQLLEKLLQHKALQALENLEVEASEARPFLTPEDEVSPPDFAPDVLHTRLSSYDDGQLSDDGDEAPNSPSHAHASVRATHRLLSRLSKMSSSSLSAGHSWSGSDANPLR